MRANARPTDAFDIIQSSAEADRLDDRRRAGLEAMRRRVVGDVLARHDLDHFTPAVEGRQLLEPLALAVEDADSGRSIDLVAGEGIEIDVEVGDVDIEMYGPLRAVDQHRYSAPVSKRYDLLDRRHRPEHIGHMGDRDDLRPVGQRALEILEQ